MELERLVAALAPEAVLGSPDPVEVRDLAYDARAVTPGGAVRLPCAAPGPTATTSRLTRWRAAPRRWSSTAVGLGVPAAACRYTRAAMAAARPRLHGGPTESCRWSASRHQRQDHHGMARGRDPRGRRVQPGLLGTVGPGSSAFPSGPAHDAQTMDLQRTFRGMLEAGDRACVMEASSHRRQLSTASTARASRPVGFTNLSQDHLDFHGDYGPSTSRPRAEALPHRGGWGRRAANAHDAWGRLMAF